MAIDLPAAYSEVLLSHHLTALSSQRRLYSQLFLPAPQSQYLTADFRLIVVGQETKGWNGSLEKFLAARETSSVDAYLREAQLLYQRHRTRSPGNSRFLQFLRESERKLDLPPLAVHWSNLFACDFNKKTPRFRPPEELAALVSLSNALLARQIEHLIPDAILFVTGPYCDGYIKALGNTYFGGIVESKVAVRRKLWSFKIGGISCFRTTHPRYSVDNIRRNDVLDQLRIMKEKRIRS